MTSDPESQAEALLCEGNRLELTGGTQDLMNAIGCYSAAVDLSDGFDSKRPDAARLKGLVWMNLGNAHLRRGDPNALELAISAFRTAIVWFEQTAFATVDRDRNTLGAAWMNFGQACLREGSPKRLSEATNAFCRALGFLSALPYEANEYYRLNCSGAGMNYANCLLSQAELSVDFLAPHAAAREAMRIIAPIETSTPQATEVGLKARRALCDAIGQLLPHARALGLDERAFADEASEAVDGGLALLEKWPRLGFFFQEVGLRLFRFGVQLYRVNQPHFLPEFIVESLDRLDRLDANVGKEEWRKIGAEALALAKRDLQRPYHFRVDDPESERRVETARALDRLEKQGLTTVRDSSV